MLWSTGKVAPSLSITCINQDASLLIDTRYEGPARYEFVDAATSDLLTRERRVADCDPADFVWALERNLICEIDGLYIPLALSAEPESANVERTAGEKDGTPAQCAA
jgi:hypothetical protein